MQNYAKKRRMAYLILGGVMLLAAWGALVIGSMDEYNGMQEKGRNPVALHATSPEQQEHASTQSFTIPGTSRLHTTTKHSTTALTTEGERPDGIPEATMSSTSLFRHSEATVHIIGGGITQNNNTTEKPIRNQRNYGGNLLALANATVITTPGASLAAEVASTAEASRPSGPRKVGRDDNIGEVGEVTPIGDAPWILVIVLGVSYSAYAIIRKRKTQNI